MVIDATSSIISKLNQTGRNSNLVRPYRRKFLARIKRDDGFAVTTVPLERELVTLRSKTRGEGDASKRYMSDTKFYATAPIRGLVYTVVHDPGGKLVCIDSSRFED